MLISLYVRSRTMQAKSDSQLSAQTWYATHAVPAPKSFCKRSLKPHLKNDRPFHLKNQSRISVLKHNLPFSYLFYLTFPHCEKTFSETVLEENHLSVFQIVRSY